MWSNFHSPRGGSCGTKCIAFSCSASTTVWAREAPLLINVPSCASAPSEPAMPLAMRISANCAANRILIDTSPDESDDRRSLVGHPRVFGRCSSSQILLASHAKGINVSFEAATGVPKQKRAQRQEHQPKFHRKLWTDKQEKGQNAGGKEISHSLPDYID